MRKPRRIDFTLKSFAKSPTLASLTKYNKREKISPFSFFLFNYNQ